ncbi:hypothetical protein RUM44_000694 [Polyplax serrata]|uniref:Uncharacterized protein n=1 Tax=Polyplax serrata TaxID=468196 RepID=A0ABR1B8D2_POLSC
MRRVAGLLTLPVVELFGLRPGGVNPPTLFFRCKIPAVPAYLSVGLNSIFLSPEQFECVKTKTIHNSTKVYLPVKINIEEGKASQLPEEAGSGLRNYKQEHEEQKTYGEREGKSIERKIVEDNAWKNSPQISKYESLETYCRQQWRRGKLKAPKRTRRMEVLGRREKAQKERSSKVLEGRNRRLWRWFLQWRRFVKNPRDVSNYE